jgi:hypothetical protein
MVKEAQTSPILTGQLGKKEGKRGRLRQLLAVNGI